MKPLLQETLIVFAKVPETGAVKTRLTTLLTAEEAAGLYAAFLKDALVQYSQLGVSVRLYLSPTSASLPDGFLQEGNTIHVQSGTGLGERMLRAILETFADGAEQVVVIGTDHPSLPSAFIHHAFEALNDRFSICIGPSEDGGYYLIGMNEFYPSLFTEMTYSHAEVFSKTLQRAEDTGANLVILPGWYDVDTPPALRKLAGDLAMVPEQAHHTRRMIHELAHKYPGLLTS